MILLPDGNRRDTFACMPRLLTAIREAIERSDESAAAISRGAGVNRSQVSRLMSGERSLSIESAERLMDYLGLEVIQKPKRLRKKVKQ